MAATFRVPTDRPHASGRCEFLRQELRDRISRLVGPQQRLVTEIPGLLLVRRTKVEAAMCFTYEPSLAVIAQGRKRVQLADRTFVYDESHFLLTALDLPVVSQLLGASEKHPFISMALTFQMPMVRELISKEAMAAPAPSSLHSPNRPAIATGVITEDLLDACCRLVRLLDSPREIPVLAPLIQQEIVYRVLNTEEGARLRAIATHGNQSNRAAKAVAWLNANYTQPLHIEELARMAGMGVSTLHHHFRALTAMSPLQYQKQLRLHAARARMLAEGLDAATAAFAVGYESPSQFSREYSRLFGLPPARDIRTLRETGQVG